ncbi:MAG: GtrA family protein [Dehalococcoidia bacterium]|nr:GtrA family protein [Dehalococcoidia bacterium]
MHIRDLRGQDILRLVKFCLVGLSGVFVSVGTLWLLTDVAGLFYVMSAILSHVLSVTNNFAWNQIWTFRDRSRGIRFSVIVIRWFKFLLTTGIAAGLFLGILTLLTEVFGLYYIVSALCAIAIATPVNFLTSNFWVWKHSEKLGQNDIAKEP